jgi:PPM family protein phosphatase
MTDSASTAPADVSPLLEFASLTDTGRARHNNEDTVKLDPLLGLAVLADGMGGYNAGEVASDLAAGKVLEHLSAWLRQSPGPHDDDAIRQALSVATQQANQLVHDAAGSRAEYAGMGTTLVSALFAIDSVWIAHVGDSRAYRLRGALFEQLGRDHSLLQEQIDAGLLTPEEASYSMHRNLVTRAVGVEPEVLVDVHAHDLRSGDLVLLCSDGLSDMLPDVVIAQVMRGHESLEAMAQALVDAANAAGGRDNIAVVLARVRGGLTRAGRGWWPFRR